MDHRNDSAAKKLSPRDWSATLLRPRHLALGLVMPRVSSKPQRDNLPDLDTLCDLCIDGRVHAHLS